MTRRALRYGARLGAIALFLASIWSAVVYVTSDNEGYVWLAGVLCAGAITLTLGAES